MDTFRTAVLAACFAALALTLAEGLLPLERFSRQLRLMMSLLLLTAVLTPLTGLHFDFKHENAAADAAAEDLTALAEAAYEQAVSERITDALNNALAEHGVSCTVRSVSVHIQEDGSIKINEAVITGNTLTGTVYLREWLGNDVTVTKEDSTAWEES